MPYITQGDRAKYTKALVQLIEKLDDEDFNPGHMNYIMSKIAKSAFDAKPSYSTVNTIMGVFASASAEFYRKRAAVLEDEKEKLNGSI